MGIRAAIDSDHDAYPFLPQAQQRRGVRPVALAQAIGYVDPGRSSGSGEEPRQQRRGCRAIDVVIAEDAYRLAVAHGVDEPRRSRVHVAQMRRVGQLVAQPGG